MSQHFWHPVMLCFLPCTLVYQKETSFPQLGSLPQGKRRRALGEEVLGSEKQQTLGGKMLLTKPKGDPSTVPWEKKGMRLGPRLPPQWHPVWASLWRTSAPVSEGLKLTRATLLPVERTEERSAWLPVIALPGCRKELCSSEGHPETTHFWINNSNKMFLNPIALRLAPLSLTNCALQRDSDEIQGP